jgi:hypothetical protein
VRVYQASIASNLTVALGSIVQSVRAVERRGNWDRRKRAETCHSRVAFGRGGVGAKADITFCSWRRFSRRNVRGRADAILVAGESKTGYRIVDFWILAHPSGIPTAR